MSARAKAVVALAAGLAALAYGLWVQDLPAPFAAVVALAFGVLGFMAVRVWERLRPLYRRGNVRRPPPDQ